MGKTRGKTHEQFLKEMEELHPDIEVLTEYVAAKIHVECKCKICGYQWKAKPLNLTFRKNPTGCPLCSHSLHKTIDVRTCSSVEQAMQLIQNPSVEWVANHAASLHCGWTANSSDLEEAYALR